jgi:hypothetical protein
MGLLYRVYIFEQKEQQGNNNDNNHSGFPAWA